MVHAVVACVLVVAWETVDRMDAREKVAREPLATTRRETQVQGDIG